MVECLQKSAAPDDAQLVSIAIFSLTSWSSSAVSAAQLEKCSEGAFRSAQRGSQAFAYTRLLSKKALEITATCALLGLFSGDPSSTDGAKQKQRQGESSQAQERALEFSGRVEKRRTAQATHDDKSELKSVLLVLREEV